MRNNTKLALALLIAMAATPAFAGNDNGPTFFGDTTNNNQTYNQPTATGGTALGGAGGDASATGIGLGVGVGTGGDATATGGSVGDIRNTNTNTAFGGQGGQGGVGIGLGGSASQGQLQGQLQGQQQGQGQSQSNVGVNSQGQSLKNTVGQSTDVSTATAQSQSNSVDASSKNDNKSTASGNATNVSITEVHPDDVTIRQAPAMVAFAAPASASCYKTFSGTLSGILGGAGWSGGKIDEQCEFRETVRIASTVDADGAVKMLCLSQLYGIANPQKCAGIRPVYVLEGKAARQYRANQAAK